MNSAKSQAMGIPARSSLNDLQVVLNSDHVSTNLNDASRNSALGKKREERVHMSQQVLEMPLIPGDSSNKISLNDS